MAPPIAILNANIVTDDGLYRTRTISHSEARDLVADAEIDSAIGHESTAELLTALLGRRIPVHRQQFEQQPGQSALVFKLHGRPPEGRILDRAELLELGYTFHILERIDVDAQLRYLEEVNNYVHANGVYNDDIALLSTTARLITELRQFFS